MSVGWSLLLSLLPTDHAIGNYSQTPRFRPSRGQEAKDVPLKEYWDFVRVVFDLCLERLQSEPTLWPEMVPKIDDLPKEYRDELYPTLRSLSGGSEEVTAPTWSALDRLWRRHREYASTDWALPAEDIAILREICDLLEPADVWQRYVWLFDDGLPDLGTAKATEDYEAELEAMRIEAITVTGRVNGWHGALRIAEASKSPGAVGYASAKVDLGVSPAEVADSLDAGDSWRAEFAFAWLGASLRGDPDRLLDLAAAFADRPQVQARLLRLIDNLPTAWAAAEELGPEVDAVFWREFNPFGRSGNFAFANETARKLAEHDRPAMALDLLVMYRRRNDGIDAKLIVDLFGQLLRGGADTQSGILSNYEITELMKVLRASPDIDEDTLARLEWQLLPALDSASSESVLQRRLSSDPEFFVEVLSYVYRAKDQPADEPTDTRQKIATNGWRLLRDWKLLPGWSEESRTVDTEALRGWVNRVRELVRDPDRVDVAELQIGQLLAQAHSDDGDVWPPSAVRHFLEEESSPTMLRGFSVGTYNKRGVTSRSLMEGGRQERHLAAVFRGWAEKAATDSPKTARVLRELAEGYEAEARRNDEETRRLQEGFGL